MVTGIVIPHETTVALQKVEFQNLTDYQTAVGGYIETVHLEGHPLVIVADEDGNAKRLPVNRRATCLWWLLNPDGLGGDFLVGDIVILGAPKRGDIYQRAREALRPPPRHSRVSSSGLPQQTVQQLGTDRAHLRRLL